MSRCVPYQLLLTGVVALPPCAPSRPQVACTAQATPSPSDSKPKSVNDAEKKSSSPAMGASKPAAGTAAAKPSTAPWDAKPAPAKTAPKADNAVKPVPNNAAKPMAARPAQDAAKPAARPRSAAMVGVAAVANDDISGRGIPAPLVPPPACLHAVGPWAACGGRGAACPAALVAAGRCKDAEWEVRKSFCCLCARTCHNLLSNARACTCSHPYVPIFVTRVAVAVPLLFCWSHLRPPV